MFYQSGCEQLVDNVVEPFPSILESAEQVRREQRKRVAFKIDLEFVRWSICNALNAAPGLAEPNYESGLSDASGEAREASARRPEHVREPDSRGGVQDYEPEQAYGSASDLRKHLSYGGTLEDY